MGAAGVWEGGGEVKLALFRGDGAAWEDVKCVQTVRVSIDYTSPSKTALSALAA